MARLNAVSAKNAGLALSRNSAATGERFRGWNVEQKEGRCK